MSKRPLLFIIIFAVILILSAIVFNPSGTIQSPTASHTYTSSGSASVVQAYSVVYTGTMPCADCAGIDTTLTLYTQQPGDGHGTFSETLVYQGRDVEPFTMQGTWTTLRGMPGNNNATVLELISGSDTSYFQQLNPTTLQALDGDQNPLPPSLNAVLTRQ